MNHHTSTANVTNITLGSPLAGLAGVPIQHTPTASEELKCLEEALDGLDTNLKDLESRLHPIRLSSTQTDGGQDCSEPQVSSFTSDVRKLKQRVIATARWVNDLTNQINL